jgi:hypothetical protein
MSKTLLVKVLPLPDDPRFNSRPWLFGEAVFVFLRDTPWGTADLGQIDKMHLDFEITAIKQDNLRRLSRWLHEEAERHGLQIELEERQP